MGMEYVATKEEKHILAGCIIGQNKSKRYVLQMFGKGTKSRIKHFYSRRLTSDKASLARADRSQAAESQACKHVTKG